ncbi:MAG TPA: hypothetical protein OIL90_05785 [Phascolarctobacterium faecium]|uniref:hypothetical protein n=1 Tax=Phascolarctobacterium faecium TaxID=33025 RepID=UPI00242E8C0B|nr:hypothetical protein [Phascolarctobacterium faecium]HJI09616.1 hypothetical protein [Phascolarctobacterium faecium]
MKKIKVMVLTLVIMLTMGLAMVAEAESPESREVMERLYGTWSPNEFNYDLVINADYFDGRAYHLKQAYIDGSWLYAYIDINGVPMTILSWRVKDAGTVYNALKFWNSKKPESYDLDIYLRKY